MDSLRDLSHRTVYQSTHRPDGPRRATMGSYSIFYSTLLCTEVSENQPRIRLWHSWLWWTCGAFVLQLANMYDL